MIYAVLALSVWISVPLWVIALAALRLSRQDGFPTFRDLLRGKKKRVILDDVKEWELEHGIR